MQHFLSNLLAQGRVTKLVVINGTTVRVYVDSSSSSEVGMLDGGAPSLSSGLHLSDGSADARSGGVALSGGSSGARGGGFGGGSEAAAYYFTIGGIEQFEEKLEGAQAALGIPLRECVCPPPPPPPLPPPPQS